MIVAPFGHPKWFPNRFKSDPETYQKIDRQIIEHLCKIVPKMNPSHGIRNDPFGHLFGSKNRSKINLDFWLILGTQKGPINDFGPKIRHPKLPKWCPRAAHSHPKWFQTHFQNRPMFKNRIRISRVIPKKTYVEEMLRRCSAQRAQSAAAPSRCFVGV